MRRDIQQKVGRWLKENEQSGIRFLSALVREPSAQGNEASAQQLVARKLGELGLEVDVWEPGGEALLNHNDFHSPRTNFSGSPNVVGIMRGVGEGRSIILNGHIDVVPEGDLKQWTEDPYSGKIKDGKLFGRGSTDMKGGTVSLLLAMEAIKACGVKLKGDVIFQSVVEEESGGAGTLSAALRGYKADAALIPEPTRMRVFPKQQGSMWFRFHIEGRLAHGGTRYEGVSAIEKSMLVIEEIRRLETERNQRITDPLYERTPIPIPINVGVIEGGNWPSSVPDQVKIEGRMGVAPEETIENAQQELRRCVDRLKEVDPWFKDHPPVLEWYGGRWVPGSIDVEHELMNILVEQYRDALGSDPIIEASPWGTDGGLLNKVAKTPTIVFGPGETDVAHQANEYVDLENVMRCAEIVAHTVMKWCGIAKIDA